MLHLVYNYVFVVLQVSMFCDDSESACDKTAGKTNNFYFWSHKEAPYMLFIKIPIKCGNFYSHDSPFQNVY